MRKDWLVRKLTIEEADATHLITSEALGPEPVPFGFCNADWQRLLAVMQPGDEIWEFSSASKIWEHMCGRAGVTLVRNGEIVSSVVTSMN